MRSWPYRLTSDRFPIRQMTVASVIECFTRVLGDGARWVHEADAQAVHEASLPVGWYRALHAGRSTGELERLTIEQIALRNRGN